MADRSDNIHRRDGATVSSEEIASENDVKSLTSSHGLELLNANGEIAMETQSTSAVLDIDGNPHSDAMNKPTQNGMREVDLSTTKEGIERACTGCESGDETEEVQSYPMDCNVKRNEEDLIEPCPVENIESDTTGEIQTLPTEGLEAKSIDVKSVEAQPNTANIDGNVGMTDDGAQDEPTQGTPHMQPTNKPRKTLAEAKSMTACFINDDDDKDTADKQSYSSSCDGGLTNEGGGGDDSGITTQAAKSQEPVDESQKPILAEANISKSEESIVSDVLVDVLTKVCDDHCIKSSHTNGVSETSTDHGPPDIGDEKSIVDGLGKEDTATEISGGSHRTGIEEKNSAEMDSEMETETSVSTTGNVTRNIVEDADIEALAKQFIDDTRSPVAPASNAAQKFRRVGQAQKVSHAPKMPPPRIKRTEKFVVKNVSKVSKIFRVSNLNYKIKPVLKNASSLSCPVVYLGELAFIDLEDFVTEGKRTDDRHQAVPDCQPNGDSSDATDSTRTVVKRTSPFSLPDFVRTNAANGTVNSDLKIMASDQTSPDVQFPNHSGFRIIARQVPRSVISNASKPMGFEKLATVTAKSAVPRPAVKSFKYEFAKNAVVSKVIHKPAFSRPVNVQVPVITAQKTVPNKRLVPYKKVVTLPTTVVPKTQACAINVFPPYTPSHMGQDGKVPTLHGSKLLVVNSAKCKHTVSGSLTAIVDSDANSNVKRPISFKTIGTVKSADCERKRSADSTNKPGADSANKRASGNDNKVKGAAVKQTAGRGNNQAADSAKEQVTVESRPPVLQPSLEIQKKYLPGSLRSGVEVSFEDGVRHFITNLSKMMHVDDEPISSWSELKKGMTVAAKWTDGHFYDATVVACYFPVDKKMQPVVQLESLPSSACKPAKKCGDKKQIESAKPNSNAAKTGKNGKRVGCTQCRAVFESLVDFRRHQGAECKSAGVIVPESAAEVTDAMVEAVTKTKRKPEEVGPGRKLKAEKTDIRSAWTKRQAIITPVKDDKAERKRGHAKVGSESSRAVKRAASRDSRSPPRKKAKSASATVKQRMSRDDFGAIFKIGTKFLHRWQLDNGGSKWYQGEVLNITHDRGSFLNWEFEVSYKGEEDNYLLKLYEDFPTDIRIIG